MNHFEFAASESFVSNTERRWIAWVDKVECLLGHSLDGDEQKDGYSLDCAHDAFMEGESPVEYALSIRAETEARRQP